MNRLRWYLRLPLKCGILALTVFLVCFPYPNLFLRHVRHWRDPSQMIEPDHPGLQEWHAALRPEVASATSPQDALAIVQRFVYRRVPYDWDWNTWGTSDYLPTVSEVLAMGREDCDGRAVIAASLLRRLGYQAEIVADFAHVWVKTEHGETMSPGARPLVVATQQGVKVSDGPGVLAQFIRATCYGIAVFPWSRELVVLCVLWLLSSGKLNSFRPWIAAVLLVAGWLAMRKGGEDHRAPIALLQWGGAALVVLAWSWQWFGWPRQPAGETTKCDDGAVIGDTSDVRTKR